MLFVYTFMHRRHMLYCVFHTPLYEFLSNFRQSLMSPFTVSHREFHFNETLIL